jgi:hypothetical protein
MISIGVAALKLCLTCKVLILAAPPAALEACTPVGSKAARQHAQC